MPASLQLIDNLPLYSRILDEAGLLEHICNALQPQYDSLLNRLDLREIYYNPKLCPAEWLDHLGQYVGLATLENEYLGFGLNPDWEPEHKRLVIERANQYFARKGTHWAIREGILLWLKYLDAHNQNQLIINLPFGESPTAMPPNWWHYYTCYDAHLYQTWQERQQYGAGDYPQLHQPDYQILTALPEYTIQEYYSLWNDRNLEHELAPEVITTGSGLGTQRPWMHFHPSIEPGQNQWNNIFPDIVKLNPALWNTHAEPEVFGWIDIQVPADRLRLTASTSAQFREEETLDYDGFKYGDIWHYLGQDFTYSEIITTELEHEISPGHGYYDTWNSADFPTPDDYLYFVPYQVILLEEEITITEPGTCTPGFVGEIERFENQLIPAVPAVPAGQVLEKIDGFYLGMSLNIWIDPVTGNPRVPPVRIRLDDLDDFPPMDLSDIEPIDLDISFDVQTVKRDINPVPLLPNIPPMSAPSITLSAEDEYVWREPMLVHRLGVVWGESEVYYRAGIAAIPERVEFLPVIEQVEFCNLVDRYSVRWIERSAILIPVDLDEIPIAQLYPLLESINNGNQWSLLIETSEQIYLLKPVTMFWSDSENGPGTLQGRSQVLPSTDTEKAVLYLEFVMQSEETQVISYTLLLNNQTIQATDLAKLNLSNYGNLGISATIPVEFSEVILS